MEKKSSGGYGYIEGKSGSDAKALPQSLRSLPSSTTSLSEVSAPQTTKGKKYSNSPSGTPIRYSMKSPLLNDVDNYNTENKISTKKEEIRQISANKAGEKVLSQEIHAAKANYPEGAPERTRLDLLGEAVEESRPVPAAEVAKLTGKPVHMDKMGNANTYKIGTEAKHSALNALDEKIVDVRHGHPHAQSDTQKVQAADAPDVTNNKMHAPEAKKAPAVHTRGKKGAAGVFGAITTAIVGGVATSSTADAKGMPHVISADNALDITPPQTPMSTAEKISVTAQAGFNGLNAAGAVMEMQGGASRNIMDLGKVSAYKDGAKTVLKDAADISDFKGVASSFAEKGVVSGAKAGGKYDNLTYFYPIPLFFMPYYPHRNLRSQIVTSSSKEDKSLKSQIATLENRRGNHAA